MWGLTLYRALDPENPCPCGTVTAHSGVLNLQGEDGRKPPRRVGPGRENSMCEAIDSDNHDFPFKIGSIAYKRTFTYAYRQALSLRLAIVPIKH